MVEPGMIPHGVPLLQMLPIGLVVFIGIIILGIVDLYFVLFKKTSSSVSQFLITTSFRSPIVSWTFGVVSGHLWFPMYEAGKPHGTLERLWYAACGAFTCWAVMTIVSALRRKP